MIEEINTGGGAAVQGDAKTGGGDFTGRDSSAARQALRGGDTYYGGGSQNDMNIWVKILEMAAQIREITSQMRDLAGQLENLPGRISKLERTEVVIREGPEVVIRPSLPMPAPDSINLSVRAIFTILIVALALVVALVVVLVFLRVTNV